MRASFSRRNIVPVAAAALAVALLSIGSSEQPAAGAGRAPELTPRPAPRATRVEPRAKQAPRQLPKPEALALLAAARRAADASRAEELFASRSWYKAPPP